LRRVDFLEKKPTDSRISRVNILCANQFLEAFSFFMPPGFFSFNVVRGILYDGYAQMSNSVKRVLKNMLKIVKPLGF